MRSPLSPNVPSSSSDRSYTESVGTGKGVLQQDVRSPPSGIQQTTHATASSASLPTSSRSPSSSSLSPTHEISPETLRSRPPAPPAPAARGGVASASESSTAEIERLSPSFPTGGAARGGEGVGKSSAARARCRSAVVERAGAGAEGGVESERRGLRRTGEDSKKSVGRVLGMRGVGSAWAEVLGRGGVTTAFAAVLRVVDGFQEAGRTDRFGLGVCAAGGAAGVGGWRGRGLAGVEGGTRDLWKSSARVGRSSSELSEGGRCLALTAVAIRVSFTIERSLRRRRASSPHVTRAEAFLLPSLRVMVDESKPPSPGTLTPEDALERSPYLENLKRKGRLAPSRLTDLLNAATGRSSPPAPEPWECCGSSCAFSSLPSSTTALMERAGASPA